MKKRLSGACRKWILPAGLLLLTQGCSQTYVGESPAKSFQPEVAASTRITLGLQYLQSGNFTLAKSNLDRAYEFAPKMPDTHLALAHYYQAVTEWEQAEQHYRRALSLDRSNGDARNNYGAFLCARGRYDEADEQFRRAVRQKGYLNVAGSYENAALCASERGYDEEALGYFRSALAHDPRNGRYMLQLSSELVAQEEFDEAALYLRRYDRANASTANSLWLNLQVANATGSFADVERYGSQLAQQFPQSEQAKRFLANDY